MTRYVIGPDIALRLAQLEAVVPAQHQLVAPTLIRSQVLAHLYGLVRRGELDKKGAERQLDYLRGLQLRLLGDRVLQRVAWKIADQLGVARHLRGGVHRPDATSGRCVHLPGPRTVARPKRHRDVGVHRRTDRRLRMNARRWETPSDNSNEMPHRIDRGSTPCPTAPCQRSPAPTPSLPDVLRG